MTSVRLQTWIGLLILLTGFVNAQEEAILGDDKKQTAEVEKGMDAKKKFERTEKILEFVSIINSYRAEDPLSLDGLDVVRAIENLGHLNAIEALDIIVEKLEFRDPTASRNEDASYPALAALIKIGPGALPGLLEAILSKDRSQKFLYNATRVIISWYGDKDKAQELVGKYVLEYFKRIDRLEALKKLISTKLQIEEKDSMVKRVQP